MIGLPLLPESQPEDATGTVLLPAVVPLLALLGLAEMETASGRRAMRDTLGVDQQYPHVSAPGSVLEEQSQASRVQGQV